MPRIQAFRNIYQPLTAVNAEETLDVRCTVERVYPATNLEFQLMSGDSAVSSRQLGFINGTSTDGSVSVSTLFSVSFRLSYSVTQDGLICRVYHPRGINRSERLQVMVSCEYDTL